MTEPAYTEQDLVQQLSCCIDCHEDHPCIKGLLSIFHSYAARIRSEARAGMREACAEVAEALALKLCWHCAEHVKNGYKFMGYGHTEVDLDSGDARQIYAAVGTGENWSHLIRTESGLEWSEKCKAWMLWSIVYGTPDTAADEAIERLKAEAEREGLVKLRDYFSASHESTLKVGDYGAAYMKLWVELNERIADLSQPKETP